MKKWKEVLLFMYGRGSWYGDPLAEVEGLTEDQLFWVPADNCLPIIWHVGHIAHRERVHIGKFLQALPEPVVPPAFRVFGGEWTGIEQIKSALSSVQELFAWVRQVRQESISYISGLGEEDFHSAAPTLQDEMTVAHWLLNTASHTALHIGRIQLLRAMLEGRQEPPC
ncbi:MAG: DinB family protein [bacterium]|jgi:hypothetical protein|nr:DinB family protein [candidate division KSB1 bacterium]MDH7561473.1 DinB family protein [bacterium]